MRICLVTLTPLAHSLVTKNSHKAELKGRERKSLGQIFLEKKIKKNLLDPSLRINFQVLEVNPLNLLSFSLSLEQDLYMYFKHLVIRA